MWKYELVLTRDILDIMKWYLVILASLIISTQKTNKQSGSYVKKNMETWYVYVSC